MAVVPGAAVSVTSVERGVTRQTVSRPDGTYEIPLLQPGDYVLRVEAAGFQPYTARGVVITVGQLLALDVGMKLGSVLESVEIRAEIPLIETQRTQQANTIEERQIDSLPLVDRNFVDLAFTQPGIVSTAAAQAQNARFAPQRSSGMSVGGGNGRSNYFTIDGGENELGTGGLRVRNLSVDAVQEFQVNRNAYSAEYGFTAGTATNVITKSGGKDLHGGPYIFYRSQKTSARNPFDFSRTRRFEQRVYPGFTLGGPIARNRAFFFTSYEALKLDETHFRSYTNDPAILALTLDQTDYLAALTSGPAASAATRAIADSLRTALAVTPATIQFLRDAESTQTLPTRTHNWTSRLDDQIGTTSNLTGRFTLARESNSLLDFNNVQSFGRGIKDSERDYTAVGTWSRIFGTTVVNQARIQLVKDRLQSEPFSSAPTINIAGILGYGRNAVVPSYLDQKRYQLEDVLSWHRPGHDFKFGVSYRPVDMNIYNEILGGGFFQFAGGLPLTILQPGLPALPGSAPPGSVTITALQSFQLKLPQLYQQGFGNGLFSGFQTSLGAFAQDSWKISRRLTLDAGIRLNHYGEPKPLFVNNYVSPRLGFALDVRGNGKTVVRGGGGTFYSPVANMIFSAATLQSDEGDHFIIPTRTLTSEPSQRPPVIWNAGLSSGKLPNVPLTPADVTALGIVIAPRQPGRRISSANTDYENP